MTRPEGRPAPEVSFDPATHVAVLPYSSGTTGVPKGVMLSHRNLVANVAQCRVNIDLRNTDRVLAVLPFFHIYGMTVLLNLALKQRAALVTMPRFDLVQFLENIQRFGCTYLYIAPPIAVKTTASIRNWIRILTLVAPTALRILASLLAEVTMRPW